ncbi:hypothetical protein [Persicobacter diffluens]|uniref:Uncharacterized protein n=1 Tax=Persicobacter diffluens TaxID=981 RepID=A0AAN4W3I6_9BACT|nr:hypothetical protein PEDI_45300 [Persicobacter diffluens]
MNILAAIPLIIVPFSMETSAPDLPTIETLDLPEPKVIMVNDQIHVKAPHEHIVILNENMDPIVSEAKHELDDYEKELLDQCDRVTDVHGVVFYLKP